MFNVLQRTLTDIRDGETYRVRKLADGNVWMTENLRLVFSGNYVGKYDSSNNTITATTTQITPANSDVSATWLPGHTTETSATRTTWFNEEDKNTQSAIDTPHSEISSETQNTRDGESQKIGAFYNTLVATAGAGDYSLGHKVTVDSTICPKNWSLPKGAHSSSHNVNGSLSHVFLHYDLRSDGTIDFDGDIANGVLSFPISLILGGVRTTNKYYSDGASYRYITNFFYIAGSNRNIVFQSFDKQSSTQALKYDTNGGTRAYGYTIRCMTFGDPE